MDEFEKLLDAERMSVERFVRFRIAAKADSDDVLQEIYLAQKQDYGSGAAEYANRIGVRFADEDMASAIGPALEMRVSEKLYAAYSEGLSYTLDTKWRALTNVLELYGTFLFLGILLGFVCLFSTILIIYYKQISEG